MACGIMVKVGVPEHLQVEPLFKVHSFNSPSLVLSSSIVLLSLHIIHILTLTIINMVNFNISAQKDQDLEGMWGMHTAQVILFFLFNYSGTTYPCALVRWFVPVGEEPCPDTGMWIVEPDLDSNHKHISWSFILIVLFTVLIFLQYAGSSFYHAIFTLVILYQPSMLTM